MNSDPQLDIIYEGTPCLKKIFLINRSANPLASIDSIGWDEHGLFGHLVDYYQDLSISFR